MEKIHNEILKYFSAKSLGQFLPNMFKNILGWSVLMFLQIRNIQILLKEIMCFFSLSTLWYDHSFIDWNCFSGERCGHRPLVVIVLFLYFFINIFLKSRTKMDFSTLMYSLMPRKESKIQSFMEKMKKLIMLRLSSLCHPLHRSMPVLKSSDWWIERNKQFFSFFYRKKQFLFYLI